MACATTSQDACMRLDSQQVTVPLAAWLLRQEAQSRWGKSPALWQHTPPNAAFTSPWMGKCSTDAVGEDRCGVRVPPVAHRLAVLNAFVLSLREFHQMSLLARQIRRFSSHPDETLAWVL
jgi:hypothetical protein